MLFVSVTPVSLHIPTKQGLRRTRNPPLVIAAGYPYIFQQNKD